MRAWRGLFASLLWIHPAGRARRHEMLRTFADAVDRARATGGPLAAWREAAAECGDLVVSAAAARRRTPGITEHPRGGTPMFPTWLEWRRAVRRVLAEPGYAALVVSALALGIGANTVVFSVADATLFRGAPYPNGARLVEVLKEDPVQKFSFPGLSGDVLEEWRRHTEVFARVEGGAYATYVVTGGDEPESIGGMEVTPGLFDELGVRPALGRPFAADEGTPGRDRVAILSDGLWRKYCGADPAAIGRTIVLNETRYEIVGVMPPRFRYPAEPQKVWVPTSIQRADSSRRRLDALALLAPGVTAAQAQERLGAIAAGLNQAQPLEGGWNVRLMPPRGTQVNDTTRRALQILFGAVVLVLLIACANVANLFFAQALARQREMAIRAALGATRWRLVRELLAESLLLAGAGGALGFAIAWWGGGAVAALAPEQLTRWSAAAIGIDGRVLLFTLGVSVATGLAFGVVPAVHASRPRGGDSLKGRTPTDVSHVGRLRHALVVAEVALSVVLLVGAALLIRSFVRLSHVDVGFDAENLLAITMSLPADKYTQAERRAFYGELSKAVTAMPGVASVTLANGVPPSGGSIHFSEHFEAEGGQSSDRLLILPDTSIAPGYFATLGIPIVDGRAFRADEPDDSVIISQGMAERFWPGQSPVGRRLRVFAGGPWRTVVGVAAEVRQMGIADSRPTQVRARRDHETAFEMYSPLWSGPERAPSAVARPGGPRVFAQATFIVRAGNPIALVPSIKAAVRALDRDQPIGQVALVEHLMSDSIKEQRFALVLMTSFAGLALVLAAAGLYAVLAHIVLQRRQEIGIRVALGAAAGDVLRLIVSRGAGLAAAGLALGLASAFALSRYIGSQLYEVSAHDPASFAAVASTLMAVAVLACWLPTRRALAVEPAEALRAE